MMGWQWHPLDHMQIICTSLQTTPGIAWFSFPRPLVPGNFCSSVSGRIAVVYQHITVKLWLLSVLMNLTATSQLITWSCRHTVNSSPVNSSHTRLVTQSTRHKRAHNKATSCIIFQLHRSTTFVDVACCCRPSSVVCGSVGLSVCWSVTLVSPAKTAAPIEMPFGLWPWVGPGNHVLDGVQIPHRKEQFWGGKGKIAITGFVRTIATRKLVMEGFEWSAEGMHILPILCT